VKPREPRRNVMLTARMRHGEAWSDACILNISSRGLLLHAADPPSRGTFIEVRRGAYVIVARVIWAKTDRFGVCAQDRLAIDALVANKPSSNQPLGRADGTNVERRARPRSDRLEWRYSRSREKGQALQFACVVGLGLGLAACAYEAVTETLSKPLSLVSRQLAKGE
jgi:hypothetical protein